MVPRFRVHSSGLSSSTPASRSWTDMPVPPPVEMLITTSLRCLMPDAYSAKIFGSADGLPSFGSRACRCRIAAPASAAATPCSTMSSGVYGRCGDIDGVWPEPVSAHVMMTFCGPAIATSMACSRYERSDTIVTQYLQVTGSCPEFEQVNPGLY